MSEENGPQEKDWWEQEDKGYNTHIYLKAEYDWEDETKRISKERLGLVDKDTEDDSRSEGEEKENYEDDGEKIVDEANEDDDDDDNDNDNDDDDEEGHRKRRSNRREK